MGANPSTQTALASGGTSNVGDSSLGAIPNVIGNFGRNIWSSNEFNNGPFTKDVTGSSGRGTATAEECKWTMNLSLVSSLYKNEQSYIEPANIRVYWLIKF